MTILCWSKQDKILFFGLGSLIFSLKYWNKMNYIQRGMVVLVPNWARVSVLTLVIFPCSMKQILADCVHRGWCLDCGPGPASCPSSLTAAEGGGIWLETYWDEKIHKIFKRKNGKQIDNLANFLSISPNQTSFSPSVSLVPSWNFLLLRFQSQRCL